MTGQTQTDCSKRPFHTKWTSVPFCPAKFPFFYGWVIVAVSTLSIVCSIPGQTAGVGVFTDYLIDALGTSRSHLATAYMIGTIISGLILPYAGKLLDRIGIRLMSILSSIGLGISLLVISNVGPIRNSLSEHIESPALPILVAGCAFLLIRFFGQGNMTMVGRVAMGKWFNHWRGIATAIAGVPIAFGFNAAPWILNKLIQASGWRSACWILAGVIGIGMALLGAIFFRERPEDCGLVMDGKVMDPENVKKNIIHTVYKQFTRLEAIRTVSFWAFSMGLATHSLIITAIAFHITDIGVEMGKTREQALMMFFYSSFISIPTRFTISYFVDNTALRLQWVLLAMAVVMGGYTVGLMYFNTPMGLWTTTACFGMAGGLFGVLLNVTFPRYFGRDHLGAVSGLNMSILVIASAVGPSLFSLGKDHLGSYRNAAATVLILPAAVLLLSFFTRNPQRRFAKEASAS
ncbi:MAG: MFS transporter [Planctomycetota bacterium]